MNSVKKMISGRERECFEYADPFNGDSGKMRLLLNGVFEDNIEREAVMLVPLFLEEHELAAIGDMWLTEQEKELGLPVGESCTSSGWWAGSEDASRDEEITDKYDFLVPMAVAITGAQDKIVSEIDRLYREQEKLRDELAKEYEVGETDWAAQLEVKIEDLERLIAEHEELLKYSKMLTIGAHVEYVGRSCELVELKDNRVMLQDNSSVDSHYDMRVSEYLKEGRLWDEPVVDFDRDVVMSNIKVLKSIAGPLGWEASLYYPSDSFTDGLVSLRHGSVYGKNVTLNFSLDADLPSGLREQSGSKDILVSILEKRPDDNFYLFCLEVHKLAEALDAAGFGKIFDVAQVAVRTEPEMPYEQKLEALKRELFMGGIDVIEDFLGFDAEEFYDDDAIESLIDQVAQQMPEEEFEAFYQKYCASNAVDRAMDLFMAGFDEVLEDATERSQETDEKEALDNGKSLE